MSYIGWPHMHTCLVNVCNALTERGCQCSTTICNVFKTSQSAVMRPSHIYISMTMIAAWSGDWQCLQGICTVSYAQESEQLLHRAVDSELSVHCSLPISNSSLTPALLNSASTAIVVASAASGSRLEVTCMLGCSKAE